MFQYLLLIQRRGVSTLPYTADYWFLLCQFTQMNEDCNDDNLVSIPWINTSRADASNLVSEFFFKVVLLESLCADMTLQIREDTKTGVYVYSLSEEYVSNVDDVTRLLLKVSNNVQLNSFMENWFNCSYIYLVSYKAACIGHVISIFVFVTK